MFVRLFHQHMQMRVQEFMRSGYYMQASLPSVYTLHSPDRTL